MKPTSDKPREVICLGVTGSIGEQTLDVIRRSGGALRLVGAGATTANLSRLLEIAHEFEITHLAINGELTSAQRSELPSHAQVFTGDAANEELAACSTGVVLNAIAGAAGLKATLATLQAGNTLALANKESLVIGGPLVLALAKPGQIVPVDSEHSAIAQCLRAGTIDRVKRLVLTASGGPFRGYTKEMLASVTPAQALAHPTWQMGPLVTINSATLVNKGLELIEAHLLFGLDIDDIDVVVHPQSIVHSMVEFVDGSTIAQASPPDMRLPIAHALLWPDRLPEAAPGIDWTQPASWAFEPLDEEVFSAVKLARRAGVAGGVAPAVINAANEVAVEAFLQDRLAFSQIVEVAAEVLAQVPRGAQNTLTLDDVLAADLNARASAGSLIERVGK